MSRTYAQITTLILRMLQDDTTTPAIYVAAETGDAIEESLKELATYDPHIVDVIFKIESRTGSDTAGGTNFLTDATKSQFLATDDDNEKVIHNTTDNTWAVVKTATTSTSVLTITNNIMGPGDSYEIYNKRCHNKKQIYIGDMVSYLEIDSVEYPLGSRRNFKVYGEILEIDVDTVKDSNSTLDPPNNIDVLVRFAMPHILSQLTEREGILTANADEGDMTIALGSLGDTEIIEVGDEFHLENHRMIHFVTVEVETDGNAADVTFYPPLEAGLTQTDAVYFVKSTLKPHHEEIFCHLVAARAVLSDYLRHINAIPKGGASTVGNYRQWGFDKLAEVLSKLERLSPPRTSRVWPKD